MNRLHGIKGSPGIAVGPVYIHDPEDPWIDYRNISEEEVESEVRRFENTLLLVADDLKVTRAQVEEKLGRDHAQIFDAHLLMLQDAALRDPTLDRIRTSRVTAEYAFWQTFQQVRRQFDAIQDEFYRARRADILDIEKRVLAKLCHRENDLLDRITGEAIVIAHDLTPSDTAHMDREQVLGFITEVGGSTSHAAIIARGLEIPAVLGVEGALSAAKPGDLAIVDGRRGLAFLNPDHETLARYQAESRRLEEIKEGLLTFKEMPAVTLDGLRVSLQGNIELPEEVSAAATYGAEGIGLYRTEYLYLMSTRLPSEEEQVEAYSKLARQVTPDPLVIRTLDLGGDKLSYVFHHTQEMNPFLGWRAIRLCLAERDLFRSQLRAILRASAEGNVRIMFPMISGVEELIEAKSVLDEARDDLRRTGVAFDESCKIGAMIEVPSAAMVADQLAEEVDFFSIGTNDLIQYTIAVDRGNERVAYLYDPFHPGVLRLIKSVVDAGHAQNIPVSVCGEMAGDPLSGLLLLGLGVDGLSMSPSALPEMKRIIRSVASEDAKVIANHVLSLRTRVEIQSYLQDVLPQEVRQVLPDTIYLDLQSEAVGVDQESKNEVRP